MLIANDVTHKAGSFGVDEDVLFQTLGPPGALRFRVFQLFCTCFRMCFGSGPALPMLFLDLHGEPRKASAYARERGLPRIHIACNSGARVGLAEELKPFFKVKWTNDDPSKGFDYLYLEESDLKQLPDDAVDVHVARVNGKKHYVIDAIIGEGLKSTQGGIGVENLRRGIRRPLRTSK